MPKITQKTVKHVASLAQIPISIKEEEQLTKDFLQTLEVVDELQSINTANTQPTHQVTGLKNQFREDVVIETQMFTQKQALANAKNTHLGFYVVPKVIDKDN